MSEEQKSVDESKLEAVSEIAEGAEKVVAAKAMGDISRDLEAAGVSDLTRAMDAEIVADRLAALSDVVEAAGELDMAEGAELLAASEDVETLSAVVGLMSDGFRIDAQFRFLNEHQARPSERSRFVGSTYRRRLTYGIAVESSVARKRSIHLRLHHIGISDDCRQQTDNKMSHASRPPRTPLRARPEDGSRSDRQTRLPFEGWQAAALKVQLSSLLE